MVLFERFLNFVSILCFNYRIMRKYMQCDICLHTSILVRKDISWELLSAG